MTRRGVPGVWTHGFYDGWAPNYMFYIANGHNAIGRFYETFGNGGADTRERKLPDSSTSRTWYRPNPPLPKVKWSLRNNVNMQQSALLLALKYVADNREEFLNNFALKSKRSVAKAKTEGPAAWIIPNDGKRPALAAQLARLLQRQGAEVHRLDRETEVKVAKPAPARGRPAAAARGRSSPRAQGRSAQAAGSKSRGGQLRGADGSALQPDGRHDARHPVLLDRRPAPLRRHRLDLRPPAKRRHLASRRSVDPRRSDDARATARSARRAASKETAPPGSCSTRPPSRPSPRFAFGSRTSRCLRRRRAVRGRGRQVQRRLVPDPIRRETPKTSSRDSSRPPRRSGCGHTPLAARSR